MQIKTKIPNTSGIYKIENLINNKVYIGKTISFYKRYHCYKSAYKKSDLKKINSRFLNSLMKYGLENFEFSIVEYCECNALSEKELYWIMFYDSTNPNLGYNLRLDSSTKMIVHESTREKISKRLRKEWEDGIRKDHGAKLAINWQQNPIRKIKQSELFSKIKTKYYYNVYNIDEKYLNISYFELKKLGLQNCLSAFHRKNRNKIKFKNYIIERYLL